MKGAIVINDLKADPLTKEFIRDDEIFADLVNGLLFEGRETVLVEDIREGDTDSSAYIDDRTVERRGDITKTVRVHGKEIVVRIENQQKPDKRMAVRNGEYTMLHYDKQIKGKRKVLPVYTFSLYYGEGEWRYPIRIRDMVEIPEEIIGKFQDWDARVVDMKKVNPKLFRNKELRAFLEALQRLYGWNKKLESLEGMILTRRAALLLGVVSGTKDLVEKVLNHQGGTVDMCKAVDEALKEREAIGTQKGIINVLKNIMVNLDVNANEAMNIAGVKEEDRERYILLL